MKKKYIGTICFLILLILTGCSSLQKTGETQEKEQQGETLQEYPAGTEKEDSITEQPKEAEETGNANIENLPDGFRCHALTPKIIRNKKLCHCPINRSFTV